MGKTLSLAVRELETPIGALTLAMYQNHLCHVAFGNIRETWVGISGWARRAGLPGDFVKNDGACAEAAEQFGRYFAGDSKSFDLPLFMNGTAFQKKVWAFLTEIPYGETRSYKEVAAAIGSPKAVRAVGMANNRNPLPIIVPCHRVVGADGSLVGYGGGVEKKRWLLQLEKAVPAAGRK
ncbi:methylated-DNA--[protein]-cysteine S-methyltransferase [Sporolactobacillus sp. THM7-7]|nr:methylated-DNA--[protein]-cysteine S-methyltransferase [Sporolactobacillus sp. THM7-7]